MTKRNRPGDGGVWAGRPAGVSAHGGAVSSARAAASALAGG